MSLMNNKKGKLEWFGGNQDALNVYRMLVALVHTWDDLVDKDKPVTEAEINNAFLIALVYLPSNPVYRAIQDHAIPLWATIVMAYETANKFEREKDEQGLEIAHNLRYATGHLVSYIVETCVGHDMAKEIVPEVWKTIVDDRFEDYRKEHLNALA
jgi:hypothetical protein